MLGWIFYRNPSKGKIGNGLVSVIIPIFNQEHMISDVIQAIDKSTYNNIEIIAVNDGSTDRTQEILEELKTTIPKLKVINKKNEGKRKAELAGFIFLKEDLLFLSIQIV